jgi:two-component system, NarL family, sensor kinase
MTEVENILIPGITIIVLVISAITILSIRESSSKKNLRFQQELLKSKIEIQNQTFQNISQEIHDNIGQVLSLVKLNLHTADFNDLPATMEKINCSKLLVGKAIVDLRDLSKSLSAEMIKEAGLHMTIQREIGLMSKTGQYKTVFTLQGQPFRFDKQKELIMFRIFQELFNNIISHSKAKTVNVLLFYQAELFNLIVSDDGDGFDDSRLATEEEFGLGIRNMQNRATLIGATFQLTSTLGKGTSVSIELPFDN